MANIKKYADLKPISEEELAKEGMPKDFWNYTVNPITGFSTLRTQYDVRDERNRELQKYGSANNYTSTKVNGMTKRIYNG
jgi:hypothetical protein